MIDTHCHIYFSDYDQDRKAVMERASQAGVTNFLLPYVDSATYTAMMNAAAEYSSCRPMMGLHPTSVNAEWEREVAFATEQLAAMPSKTFAAIGEIGIDAYWSKDFLAQQKIVFATMLDIADKYDMPVVIHCRDAFSETLEVLKNHKKPLRGVFHAFSGDIAIYKKIKELGDFKMGIGGVVTFKNSHLSEVVREIPLTDILLETDAPFLTPTPFRGKRNESSYLVHIVQKIADIKQVSATEIEETTTNNAMEMFY
jgi:TatD DNase family protein